MLTNPNPNYAMHIYKFVREQTHKRQSIFPDTNTMSHVWDIYKTVLKGQKRECCNEQMLYVGELRKFEMKTLEKE